MSRTVDELLERIEKVTNVIAIRRAGIVRLPEFDGFDDSTLAKMLVSDAVSLLAALQP
jgi:hypothetical protein